jgi:hypothetical protein
MLEFDTVSEPSSKTEKLLKVKMLGSAYDIPDGIGSPFSHPILERRHIGRRIPKTAI